MLAHTCFPSNLCTQKHLTSQQRPAQQASTIRSLAIIQSAQILHADMLRIKGADRMGNSCEEMMKGKGENGVD